MLTLLDTDALKGHHGFLCVCQNTSKAILSSEIIQHVSTTICHDPTGLYLVRADTERSTLRKEDTALFFERAFIAPLPPTKHLFIIEEAQRLNLYAANALLKLLEEPLSDCLFILTCTPENARLLPATIRSRLHKITWNFSETANIDMKPEDITLLKNLLWSPNHDVAHLNTVLADTAHLSTAYKMHVLQDVLITLCQQYFASHNSSQTAVRIAHILQNIRLWKDQEPFHPNSAYWLIRILMHHE